MTNSHLIVVVEWWLSSLRINTGRSSNKHWIIIRTICFKDPIGKSKSTSNEYSSANEPSMVGPGRCPDSPCRVYLRLHLLRIIQENGGKYTIHGVSGMVSPSFMSVSYRDRAGLWKAIANRYGWPGRGITIFQRLGTFGAAYLGGSCS